MLLKIVMKYHSVPFNKAQCCRIILWHFDMIWYHCASLNGPEWYFITILDNVTQVCVSAPLGWSFWKKNWSSARWQQHQHSSISSSMSTAKVNHKREETQTKGPKRGNSSFSVFSAQATIRPAAAAWTSWDSYHHPKTSCHHDSSKHTHTRTTPLHS